MRRPGEAARRIRAARRESPKEAVEPLAGDPKAYIDHPAAHFYGVPRNRLAYLGRKSRVRGDARPEGRDCPRPQAAHRQRDGRLGARLVE